MISLEKHNKQIKLLLIVSSLNLAINASLIARVSFIGRETELQGKALDDISPSFNLIRSMIEIESGGNPNTVSKSGAIGLMQLTKTVYHDICGLTKEEALDPSKNIACGSLYMQFLIKKHHGNLESALQYYNSGNIKTNNKYSKKVLNKVK